MSTNDLIWHFTVVRLYDDAPDCLNATTPPLAIREFGAVRGSRCYCSWHLRCVCYACSAGGLCAARPFVDGVGGSTKVLSQSEYGAAGFLGDVSPDRAVPAAEAAADDWYWETLVASLVLLTVHASAALSLGLLKALWPRYRDRWLWLTVSMRYFELDAYKEPELRLHRLVRDDLGYYVHPVTGSRNIRLLDDGRRFVFNTMFFLAAPIFLYLYKTDYWSHYPAKECSSRGAISASDSRGSGRRSRPRASNVGRCEDHGRLLESSSTSGSEYCCDDHHCGCRSLSHYAEREENDVTSPRRAVSL